MREHLSQTARDLRAAFALADTAPPPSPPEPALEEHRNEK
jgi:hypothetical protein